MRTILITGATGKIGSILTKKFLDCGDLVIGISRSNERLLELKKFQKNSKAKLLTLPIDLCEESASREIAEWLESKKIKPCSLINNARSIDFLKLQDDGSISRKNFLREFTLDVIVPYELTMALSKMNNSKLLNVVNIGSQYGLVAPNLNLYKNPKEVSPIHYGVSKAGLTHLTKEMAVRLAKNNIRVNCVAYGGVEGRVNKEFKKQYSALTPAGRMLQNQDLFGPINLLLSEESSGITGHTLVVDGGWTIW